MTRWASSRTRWMKATALLLMCGGAILLIAGRLRALPLPSSAPVVGEVAFLAPRLVEISAPGRPAEVDLLLPATTSTAPHLSFDAPDALAMEMLPWRLLPSTEPGASGQWHASLRLLWNDDSQGSREASSRPGARRVIPVSLRADGSLIGSITVIVGDVVPARSEEAAPAPAPG